MTVMTAQIQEAALAALAKRRAENPTREKIDNAKLYSGSPMYFYCESCGWLADTMPEEYLFTPRKLCTECQGLKDLGLLKMEGV